jgi:hypothetical protein
VRESVIDHRPQNYSIISRKSRIGNLADNMAVELFTGDISGVGGGPTFVSGLFAFSQRTVKHAFSVAESVGFLRIRIALPAFEKDHPVI